MQLSFILNPTNTNNSNNSNSISNFSNSCTQSATASLGSSATTTPIYNNNNKNFLYELSHNDCNIRCNQKIKNSDSNSFNNSQYNSPYNSIFTSAALETNLSPLDSLSELSCTYQPTPYFEHTPQINVVEPESPRSPPTAIFSPISSPPLSPEFSPLSPSSSKANESSQVVPRKDNNPKKARKSYEVSKKLEILAEKDKYGMAYVVDKYEISRSIISRWHSNADKYRAFQKKNLKKLHKGPKASFSEEQERVIIGRIEEFKSKNPGEIVNGETIKNIALQFSNQLGNSSFKASSGWLENFKNRWNLRSI